MFSLLLIPSSFARLGLGVGSGVMGRRKSFWSWRDGESLSGEGWWGRFPRTEERVARVVGMGGGARDETRRGGGGGRWERTRAHGDPRQRLLTPAELARFHTPPPQRVLHVTRATRCGTCPRDGALPWQWHSDHWASVSRGQPTANESAPPVMAAAKTAARLLAAVGGVERRSMGVCALFRTGRAVPRNEVVSQPSLTDLSAYYSLITTLPSTSRDEVLCLPSWQSHPFSSSSSPPLPSSPEPHHGPIHAQASARLPSSSSSSSPVSSLSSIPFNHADASQLS